MFSKQGVLGEEEARGRGREGGRSKTSVKMHYSGFIFFTVFPVTVCTNLKFYDSINLFQMPMVEVLVEWRKRRGRPEILRGLEMWKFHLPPSLFVPGPPLPPASFPLPLLPTLRYI